MKFCKNCESIACCDFCRFVIEETQEINGKLIAMAPIGCMLHKDTKHQNLAKQCSCCEDFCCIHAEEEESI